MIVEVNPNDMVLACGCKNYFLSSLYTAYFNSAGNRHESLPTLPQMGKVTQSEIKLREQLTKKELLSL